MTDIILTARLQDIAPSPHTPSVLFKLYVLPFGVLFVCQKNPTNVMSRISTNETPC